MYKYVYEILQELSTQRPSSRQKSSRCFTTQDQKETVKTSSSPNDKQLKSYVLTNLKKIQAEKQILLAKKRKALLCYKMILDKMLSPLIEYMPSVTTSYHLSKLTDFRTNEGFSEQSEETNKKRIIVRPKCVEEPLPILIKPEYKVSKCRKKGWKIMNKLAKARDSKNEMINKYKIWKNKVVKEPEDRKSLGKKQGLLVYDLFLKDAVESKIEDLMPSIKAKHEHSNVYDFRFQNEPEIEQCENQVMKHEEMVASSNKVTNSNFKGLNRGKIVIPKQVHTKTANKTDPISVKTKPYEPSSLKKKEEKVQMLNVKPTVYSKEENQTKPPVQRSLHKQNWSRSDNRMKLVKSETAKDKPVMKKNGVPSKIKKAEVIQPVSNNILSAENKVHKSTACLRKNVEEKEAEKEVSNGYFTGAGNFSEVLREKNNRSGLLQDGMFKLSDNILNGNIKSGISVTEKSEKHLDIESKEKKINDPVGTEADFKVESAVVVSLEQTDTLCDLKSNIIIDESNDVTGNSRSQSDVKFAQGREFEKNESENEENIIMLRSVTENRNNLSECEILDNPKVKNTLVVPNKSEEEKTTTPDNNVLKNTYLVSFEVKDDEAFLKTRSQVIADEIKGDLIDLNIVLEEEKKRREAQKREILLENRKCTSDNVNTLLNTGISISESQSQSTENLPKSVDKNKENRKIISAINQDVSTEPLANNLSKSTNTNSFKSNSTFNTNKNTQALKDNVPDDKSVKKISDMIMKTRTLEPNKENIIEDDKGHTKSEGKVVSEISAEHKKDLIKTHSLELIGREKKGNLLKHKKVVTAKEKNILSNIPDKRIKVMNKTKELDKSEKYQEIINSVKKIIPSSNSNESILGRNTQKIVLTGTKIKSNVNMSKNYTKTISELKDIISELPGNDNQQAISVAEYRHFREIENTKNITSEKCLKTAEEEKLVSKDEILDGKQTNIKANNKIKQINLKTIKVVDQIAKVNEELKPISADNFKIETSLKSDKEKEDCKTHLKSSKSNTSDSKNLMENKELGSQIGQNERTEENSSNLNIKKDRIIPLKQQKLSNHSHKIAENPPLKEGVLPERKGKAKSVSNIKFNERKSEESKEQIRLNSVTRNIKSDEVETKPTNTGLTPLKIRPTSVGDNASNTQKEQSFAKSKDRKMVKSAEIKIHGTFDQERGSSHLSKSTDSKLSLFKAQGSRENSKIIKAKSDLNMNKMDTSKMKGSKRINISPETNKSRGTQRVLSITGTGKQVRTITDEVTVESRENKSKDKTNTTLNDNNTFVSNEVNNNKTNSNENEKIKFSMEKIVKSAKTSIVNPRKIIKFTRLNETVLRKNTKSEDNLIRTEKKEVLPANAVKGKHSSVETMDKQTVESQKPAHTLSSVLQGKNKNAESKFRKETQPTGLLTKKMLKVKVMPNEKPKRKSQSSKLSGDGNALQKSSVQSRIQVNTGNTMSEELFNVSKRLENR